MTPPRRDRGPKDEPHGEQPEHQTEPAAPPAAATPMALSEAATLLRQFGQIFRAGGRLGEAADAALAAEHQAGIRQRTLEATERLIAERQGTLQDLEHSIMDVRAALNAAQNAVKGAKDEAVSLQREQAERRRQWDREITEMEARLQREHGELRAQIDQAAAELADIKAKTVAFHESLAGVAR